MPLTTSTRRISAAAAITLSLAFGSASAAVTTNRLATNRLATNRLATNRLATNRLATNSLSSTRLEASLATAEILATADGREVFGYLMGCALPGGTTLEATVPGAADTEPGSVFTCLNEHCVFYGSLGLAEDWLDHPLDPTGQGWVSACIFARVNFLDTAEAISLRGAHPGLAVTIDEAELYTLEEGAFFGNLFSRDDDSPIDWNACIGVDQAQEEVAGLVLRDCTEPDPADPTKTFCGFHFAGECRDVTPQDPSPYACSRTDDELGVYTRCHATPGTGIWPASPPYRQVITVFVSN